MSLVNPNLEPHWQKHPNYPQDNALGAPDFSLYPCPLRIQTNSPTTFLLLGIASTKETSLPGVSSAHILLRWSIPYGNYEDLFIGTTPMLLNLLARGTYLHHKQIKAAQGIKITAQGLEHAIAGTGLYVVGPDDDLEDIKEAAMEDMKSVLSRIDKSGEGVYVQASTLGSLEALLEFLKSPAVSIPVSGIGIGPVHKKDVMKASVMLEKKKEYATILAFDVKVTPEARELADDMGVKIFIADIIYHLFDQFKAYIDNLKEEKKREAADEAVFPCVLKIMPNCIFNKKDPIVLGVDVLEGIAKVGTPICIPQRDFIDIGRIASIENNHKPVDIAKKGQRVAIKITSTNPEEQQKMFGRHFEMEDELVSHISRKSIDTLKANYRDDLSLDEWKLVVKLKTLFKIQ
ncbi:Eukaryotic translation initiation factor 5B [Vitis vinifera]|uniref:Eukaryotic translation initiation factor 5B n=1 Tax=Vitis vinifera TaxID=29760 RepID=A0A438ICK6_VITVI|nr:Eukaryotic translation initiation factor 5B [Vitis vinifera]